MSRCIWEHIPGSVRDDILAFAEAQMYESANCTAVKEKLLSFAKRLFIPRLEATVVRPLCVILGYLNSRTISGMQPASVPWKIMRARLVH